MPTYDYCCDRCGGFDAIRPVGTRNAPAPCPDCGHPSARVLVAAPRLALIAGDVRTAIATNERARHAPQRSADVPQRHPGNCGCCRPARRGATTTGANGNKAFPDRRPWMISH